MCGNQLAVHLREDSESDLVGGSSTQSAASSASHKSDARNYFTKDKKAKCQLCPKELVFHSGTMNFHDHLMNTHSGTYKGDGGKKRSRNVPSYVCKAKVLF